MLLFILGFLSQESMPSVIVISELYLLGFTQKIPARESGEYKGERSPGHENEKVQQLGWEILEKRKKIAPSRVIFIPCGGHGASYYSGGIIIVE